MTVLRVLQFIAVVLTAMAFVPASAHLFELPHKIALIEHDYFVVQSIYRGWALFGIVIITAIAANLALALMLRRRRGRFWPSLAAGLVLAATLLVFFVWTYPANRTTNNWTMVTADWERLRAQWEWSHAANAVLNFIALCCAIAGSDRVEPLTPSVIASEAKQSRDAERSIGRDCFVAQKRSSQ